MNLEIQKFVSDLPILGEKYGDKITSEVIFVNYGARVMNAVRKGLLAGVSRGLWSLANRGAQISAVAAPKQPKAGKKSGATIFDKSYDSLCSFRDAAIAAGLSVSNFIGYSIVVDGRKFGLIDGQLVVLS